MEKIKKELESLGLKYDYDAESGRLTTGQPYRSTVGKLAGFGITVWKPLDTTYGFSGIPLKVQDEHMVPLAYSEQPPSADSVGFIDNREYRAAILVGTGTSRPGIVVQGGFDPGFMKDVMNLVGSTIYAAYKAETHKEATNG